MGNILSAGALNDNRRPGIARFPCLSEGRIIYLWRIRSREFSSFRYQENVDLALDDPLILEV